MSSSQAFSDQPITSTSASGGSQPRLIIKIPQSLQSASMVPFSNALPSAPPVAKKMRCVAFECSTRLSYPSISIMDCIPPSLPTGLQPIYEDAYLANSSPEVLDRVDVKEWRNIFRNYPSCEYCESHNLRSSCSLRPDSLLCSTCEANYPSSKKFCSFKSIFCLLQFHILAKLPLIVAYCIVSSRGLFAIWGEEWNALMTGLQKIPYYCNHPEELGLLSDRPRVSEGKRKAVVSLNAFRKSQLLQQEGICLGESSREQVVLHLYHKGKEVVRDTTDVDMEMGIPEELDAMTLDYPKDVPPPPVPVPTPSTPVWKASNNQSYCKVFGLKMWFFEPLIKQVPSNGSSPTRDKMIQTAIECVVMRMALLFAGPGKKMLEQDLWALVDGMIQGAFADLKEQLKLDYLETKNLHLKEQVSSRESQLEEKDKELARLKSFIRHFKGDVQSLEVQQLRGALEAWDGEIEELKKKLAASEEAH
ncbi:hypothetical protein GYMLUDRAFT_245923 [Collybiopsis luxurians FD-317 M1]|uniref:Unplaced genomic scaffold GYMLUscaffold_36, whole genome shotgun sequence n=1 Tax=Collybiopsis luxurians FD-317 M1 TaxID=944289 RepID=A0A0D0C7T8_9AGAR|nr:hypothetical protein GYMLUDRAFT_245923 [Collybiopsis luxurians FD-317 M1]